MYVARKWPLRGRSRFVCWNITQVSAWLLRDVHFVRSTQRTRLKTIRVWYKEFSETGCLCKQKSSGRPLTAEDDVELGAHISNIHSCKKPNFFSFPLAVNNSIKVGPLGFLL